MKPLWHDSITQTLGPIKTVCSPSWGTYALAIGTIALAAGLFCGLQTLAGAFHRDMIPRATGWSLLFLIVAMLAPVRLLERLVLCKRGVARSSVFGVTIVRWEDLDSGCKLVRAEGEEAYTGSVVVECADGRRLAITSFFAGHEPVGKRVLEEFARRATQRLEPGQTPTSTNPGITEPGT
jgi:hypothetical protein